MRKASKDLTAQEIKNLKQMGLHAVGTVSGLNLKIDSVGNKSWVLRVQIGNRRRSMGLGGYPSVSLAQAHQKARDARQLIDDGIDPIEARREGKADLRTISFGEAASKYIAAKEPEWRNSKHAQQWRNTIDQYAKKINQIPVSQITTQDIVDLLDEIWLVKNETASRLRGRIEAILGWATVRKYRHGENPARWKGHLDSVLASPKKIRKVQHHKALNWKLLPEFMKVLLEKHHGIASDALQFTIFTVCRTSEVTGAKWSEIDFENKLWVIPAERMKLGKVHRVALCKSAIKLLKKIKKDSYSDYVFSSNGKKPISNMAMLSLLKRMDGNFTVHGFRSTFRDWAAEATNHPRDVCESALAHAVGGDTELAYKRTDYLDRRYALMKDWESFIFREGK